MIRVIIQYPDYLDENNILQDGTQVIDIEDEFKLLECLKNVYNEGKVDHVHLEIGYYGSPDMFHSLGETIIPFKKGISSFVAL